MPGRTPLDVTGQRFGEWTAVRSRGRPQGNTLWECVCSCGNVCNVRLSGLRSGGSTRCRPCADRRKSERAKRRREAAKKPKV